MEKWLLLTLLYGSLCFAADITVKVEPSPATPQEGDNRFLVHLSSDGNPILAASVSCIVSMPAMGTMPYMEDRCSVQELKDGTYEARYQLSMGGSWQVQLDIKKDQLTLRRDYSLITGVPGLVAQSDSQGKSNEGLLTIGFERLQKIGVTFATATLKPLRKQLRILGEVEADATRRNEVVLRYGGFIRHQYPIRLGDSVKKGTPLFTVESPDLLTAQNEFLLSHEASGIQDALHRSASERLRYFGWSDDEIKTLRNRKTALKEYPIRAPTSGAILETNVREGASVNAGQVLYVIGDLTQNYLVCQVFLQDLPDVKVGQNAQIFFPDADGSSIEGKIDLIYPTMQNAERSAKVRVVTERFSSNLRPGSYLDVRLAIDYGEKLVIPDAAVLFSGLNRYVFVDRGEGKLEPRAITTGRSNGDWLEVTSGLKQGERVASRGTFLLSAEAQLKGALPKWKP